MSGWRVVVGDRDVTADVRLDSMEVSHDVTGSFTVTIMRGPWHRRVWARLYGVWAAIKARVVS